MNQVNQAYQARQDLKSLADSLANAMLKTLSDANAKIPGDDAEAELARGKVFQLANYPEAAISCYQSALARDPSMDEAKARLALMQAHARQPENALATAMELAQSNPDFELREMTSEHSMTAMTLLGDVLAKNNRVSDAIEAYKVASSRYKNDTFASGRLAQAYLVSGKPQKAIDELANFDANPRFHSLQRILSLGRETEALLPRYSRDRMQDLIAVSDHGRPMVLEGKSHVAPLVAGASDWCAGAA